MLHICIIGASGSGKNTVAHALEQAFEGAYFPVGVTTRTPRDGEVDGKDYHFITGDKFLELAASGRLWEWRKYDGNFYGTLHSELEKSNLLIHVTGDQGALAAKEDPNTYVLYLAVEPIKARERLLLRGFEAQKIDDRIKADLNYDYATLADKIIWADKTDKTIKEASEWVQSLQER